MLNLTRMSRYLTAACWLGISIAPFLADADSARWSFEPLAPAALPAQADSSWVRTPIDGFILAKDARIIQMVFMTLDSTTDMPYDGVYQGEALGGGA